MMTYWLSDLKIVHTDRLPHCTTLDQMLGKNCLIHQSADMEQVWSRWERESLPWTAMKEMSLKSIITTASLGVQLRKNLLFQDIIMEPSLCHLKFCSIFHLDVLEFINQSWPDLTWPDNYIFKIYLLILIGNKKIGILVTCLFFKSIILFDNSMSMKQFNTVQSLLLKSLNKE